MDVEELKQKEKREKVGVAKVMNDICTLYHYVGEYGIKMLSHLSVKTVKFSVPFKLASYTFTMRFPLRR